MFNTCRAPSCEINRVPPAIEAGAPGGYYQGAAARRVAARASIISTSRTPPNGRKWACKTLTCHEGIPGHHFQICARPRGRRLPTIRSAGGFSAYAEGWALYAEQLADELGMLRRRSAGPDRLSPDPICSAPCGWWSTAASTTSAGAANRRSGTWSTMRPNAEGSAIREIERYCVWPGQACGYKSRPDRDRRAARRSRAADGRPFRHQGVPRQRAARRALPLTVLQRRVRAWMAA